MKRLFLCFLVLLLLCSCGRSYEEQKRISRQERAMLQKKEADALKIAVMPTLDCLPVFVAKELLIYDSLGVDVRPKMFTAQMDCDTAIVGGSVEGIMSDIVRTGRIRARGIGLDYISNTNLHWFLMANRKARIRRTSQLGDKMIAMTRYSATDYLMETVVKGAKAKSQIFSIQVNDVRIRLSMLLNNEMDAAWLPEPQASMARYAGHNVLRDSRDIKRHLGIMAFRSDITADKRRKKQIALFVRGYNAACDSLNRNGLARYSRILNKYYGLDDKRIKAIPKQKYEHTSAPLHTSL